MTVTDPVVPPPAPAASAALLPEVSAVSWPAVFAGVFAALAAAFVLGELAAAFGYATPSPFLIDRAGVADFNPLAGAGMVVVEVLALGLGGYLAGRLRTRWPEVHDDEVHFRDTAHGLVVWAVTVVAGVVLAALVVGPYLEREAMLDVIARAAPDAVAGGPAAPPAPPLGPVIPADRLAHLKAQAALFMALGLIVSAFTAAVAAAVGGLRREEMHGRR
jgi:hypothetical protein